MKRVLIISPHFPPLNAPDLQRVRMSLPYYRAHGWEPVVLAIADEFQDGVREAELLATVPADVRIIRIPALPVRVARACGVGNSGLRMLPWLLWHGSRLLRREKFDLVFFSTTQFITFPLGRFWRAWFGVPYVLDLQDPWVTDYYERPGSRPPPGGWKYHAAQWQARLLEGWSFRHAAAVMSVSPDYLSDLRKRYPAFSRVPTAVIRFGGSRTDTLQARAATADMPELDRTGGIIHLVYTGASGPVIPHALTVLFNGLRHYRKLRPEVAARLRLHFVGTSYVAPGAGRPSVLPLAKDFGVTDSVTEIPHRIGHFEALRWQLQADALLLPGSSDLAYSPSKTYPYFLSGRPILGLVFRQSVLEQLLVELKCAHLVRISEGEDQDTTNAAVAAFFDLAAAGFPAGSLPARREDHFERTCLAGHLTQCQCDLFDEAIGHSLLGCPEAV